MLLIYTGNINVYRTLKKYIVHNSRPQSRDKTISYAISSILTEFIHKYHSSVHINDIHAVKLKKFQVKHIISGASDIQNTEY
mmetsp:Transcript_41876/g.67189  ORF Transcript_41876/g.67189 Transcript_41876/m.67189 type:complete len:82 (-) Transcript_41876:66-311(-)